MSIFSTLFGGTQPAPAPAAQPAQQGNPNAGQPGQIPQNPSQVTASSNNTAPNGVVPAGTPAPAAEAPLDQFKDIWQPSENKNEQQPLINVDPKSLAEAAKKTDFTKMITSEQLQAISQGGEASMQAFAQALNQVAQGVYAQSAFATTKIVESAVNKAREQFQADIPAHVKRLNVSESLQTENPAFSHPAASPILGAIQAQLTQKHPNASSGEIATMARQYLEQFANVVSAPQRAAAEKKQQEAKGSKDFDFSTFLS